MGIRHAAAVAHQISAQICHSTSAGKPEIAAADWGHEVWQGAEVKGPVRAGYGK
jgi:hypothetical protein